MTGGAERDVAATHMNARSDQGTPSPARAPIPPPAGLPAANVSGGAVTGATSRGP